MALPAHEIISNHSQPLSHLKFNIPEWLWQDENTASFITKYRVHPISSSFLFCYFVIITGKVEEKSSEQFPQVCLFETRGQGLSLLDRSSRSNKEMIGLKIVIHCKSRRNHLAFCLSSIMRENDVFCLKNPVNTDLMQVIYFQIHEFGGTLSLSILFRATSNSFR